MMWIIIFLLYREVIGCAPIEVSYDYFGDDLELVDDVGSAEECAKICGRNSGCKSWTYGKKPGQPYTRRCHLKSSVKPNRRQDDCCDSGLPCLDALTVVGNPTCGGTADGARCVFPFDYQGTTYNACTDVDHTEAWCMTEMAGKWGNCDCGCEIERSYDYFGDDLKIVSNVESAEECAKICGSKSECKSWTYGKIHPHTRDCHLKRSVKPGRRQSDCCDSGLPCSTSAPTVRGSVVCTLDASTQVLANGEYNPDCCGKPRTHCDHCSCGRTECCTASDPTAVNERNSVGSAPVPPVRTFPVSDGCPAGWTLGGSCADNRPQSICCHKEYSGNCDESCAKRECEQRGTQSNQFGQFINTAQPGEPYYCEVQVQENCDIERGVAYESSDNLLSLDNVNRAEDCALICGAMSSCQSWTYGADSSRADFRQCNLKSALRPGRKASPGSHSGLPCTFSDQNICPMGGWTRGGVCPSGECCSAPAMPNCDDSCRQAQCEAASGTWLNGQPQPTCQLQVIPVERVVPCLYEDGYDYPGNDIYILENLRSEADCAVACATVLTCRSWTYSISRRKCWLKSGEQANRSTASTDLISGLPCGRRSGNGESYIRLNKSIFTAGDALEMRWNNGDVVSREDKLAVYPSSEVQGRVAPEGALLWIYACGTQSCTTPLGSGFITLNEDTSLPAGFVGWPFPAGSYKIVLCNDASEILVKSPDFFIRDTDQLPTEVRSSSRRLELVAPDSRRLAPVLCKCHTPGAGTAGFNDYHCNDDTSGSCGNDEECFNSVKWEKSQLSHGCGPLEVSSQSHTTSPRAGLSCEATGLQGITSRTSCESACGTFQGSTFSLVTTHNSDPGCTIRVSEINRGECQWNSNGQAIAVDPNLRHVCTDPMKTNGGMTPNRSKRQVVLAPAQANCTFVNFAEVATVTDCRVACELAGRNANSFSVGRWNRPAGCWVDPAGSCTWNTQQDGDSDSGDFEQVCMRAGRHFDVCVKHRNEEDRDCCGLQSEITCQFGFKLEAPLASHVCDVTRCNPDFCNAHPEDGGAYRCVVPEYGWQPKSVGHASCGHSRQYHGKIGLQECVKTCELDPFCKSIFGALDAGDNSCWTCPSFTLRPIEQPNDGEDNDPNRDENYKAYQLKRRTKYAMIAFRNQKTCPEGYVALTETECNAVAGAVISTGMKALTSDNSKPKGCTLPLRATSASNAAPTWSTGSAAKDANTRLVCKWQVPNDALVSFNYTKFENAMVSGKTNQSSAVRDGSTCVDGSITTYCSSALSVATTNPYLRFDLKEPLMVMRLFIASRGDANVNALGRFTVRVHDGREWQLCKFRQEVNFNEQWNEVYCEDAIHGTKIEIQRVEGFEHLAIADVRVQGIPPQASVIANPRYETVLHHTACTVDAEIASQVCNSNSATICRDLGKQLCDQEINCHGFGFSYQNNEVVVTTYDKRAADEYQCGGDFGLKNAPGVEFNFKERKGIEDVICIERPCWSYNYPTDEFKHLGCSVGQLAVAKAQVENMRQLRECSNVPTGENAGEYRARCYARLRFRRAIGEDMWKIFERQEDDTRGPVCMTVRRREEMQPAELVAPQNDVRRRLMGLQRDTAGMQCRRRAQVTNTAACNNLLEAADKTVGLYQDQISLQDRREALLRRQRSVGIATGVFDLASTISDVDAGVDGRVKNPFRKGNLKENPQNFGWFPNVVAASIDLANGVTSDDAAINFATTEMGLIRREANIAKLRDMSDIAATCNARSTDDLLCGTTELREQVDEQFYNVIQLAEVQHVQVMDALAQTDILLENTLVTAESIRIAVDQTLTKLRNEQALRLKYSNTLKNLEYLRTEYNLFAGEDGVSAMSDKASRTYPDWCDFTNRLHNPSLFEDLVKWVEAPEFRKTVEPTIERRSTEQGIWTPCEKEEYRQAFTAAHRSIEIMFNWAHSIREYVLNFSDPNNIRANRVRDQRARMAKAYQTQVNVINDLPSNGAIRCVGDTPKCPAGYHITHPDVTGLPEPVTEQPCAPDTCSCQHGKAAEGHQCTGHDDAVCESCDTGYMLDGDICRLVETLCENGAPETDRLKLDEHDDQQQYCAACDEGYHPDFKTNDPTRGDFVTCEINVCYCDNTTGVGATGKDCDDHWTGSNPAFSGPLASQCASCHSGYQLVTFSSSTGFKTVCEHEDGVRLFSEDHFTGIRTRMDREHEEVWNRPQQTHSLIVLPGWCIGMRSTSDNWQSIGNPGSVRSRIRIDGEVIACNCHKDQVDRHEAAGFDNFRMQFQGMRRFRCDDPFVDFMKPKDQPWQTWSKHPSDSLVRRGTVDVELASNPLRQDDFKIREPSAYHRHHNPGRNWYGGDYDRGFICEHC